MLLLLAVWLLLYVLTSVLGAALLQTGRPSAPDKFTQTETVLAGLVATVAFVQAASVVWPADVRWVGALALAAVVINWRMAGKPLRTAGQALRRQLRRPLWWLLTAVVLLFSARMLTVGDSGLYHLPAIRWYERFGAVPGLGNLHGRLAFNSSFFVVSAAFGLTDLVGQTLFALNGFLLLLFGGYVIGRMHQPNPDGLPGLNALRLVLLSLVLYYFAFQLSSPTPDLWATLLPLFVVLLWLDGAAGDKSPTRLYLLTALVLLCPTVKLGTLPIGLLLPVLLITYRHSLSGAVVLKLLTLGALIGGPWLVRNVILSGYLLYPFPGLDLFAVDWKIPLPAVHYEQDYVTYWARYHLGEARFDAAKLTWPLSRWVPVWWDAQVNYHSYRLSRPLFVLAGASPLLMLVQQQRGQSLPGRVWAAYAVMLAGFVFWFVKAPEFRFGLAFVWLTALLPLLSLLQYVPQQRKQRLAYLPLAGLALSALLLFLGGKLIRQEGGLLTCYVLRPGWFGYRDQQAAGVRYVAHRTRSGLAVLVPATAPLEQRCYDLDQPCSPYFFDDLELRGTTPAAGFRRRASTPNPPTAYLR